MASSRNSRSTDLFENAVRERLAGMLPHGARVSVALSGGLDSSVLLSLAALSACNGTFHLSAVHVHHGLSPHADAWAAFCRERCAALGVELEIVRVTVPRGSEEGLEAAARRLRYEVFERIDAQYVLLAHHANDQAETVLFNLMRGTGVRGAAAMLPVSGESGRYLRPLLTNSRLELESYANVHSLRWIDDESNTNLAFSRNYIRHEVVPVLETRFPAAVENLARSAEYFAEAQAMLDEMARHDLNGQDDFPIPVILLKGLSKARARNALRYLLAMRGLQAPVSKRLEEALRQFIEAAPDRHPSLDLSEYRLFRARGQILLEVR
jgi:tRNA(Ile)-lysidine synthase